MDSNRGRVRKKERSGRRNRQRGVRKIDGTSVIRNRRAYRAATWNFGGHHSMAKQAYGENGGALAGYAR